jgi:hypothetical protein
MTMRVISQFIDFPVARWVNNATKNEVEGGLDGTGSTLLLCQVAPEAKGGMESATGGWAESAMGRSGDGLGEVKGSVETLGDE